MRLPNKLYSYEESIFPIFILVLREVEKKPYKVIDLYKKIQSQISCIDEYIETLDCMYAMGLIEYEEGVIKICSTK